MTTQQENLDFEYTTISIEDLENRIQAAHQIRADETARMYRAAQRYAWKIISQAFQSIFRPVTH